VVSQSEFHLNQTYNTLMISTVQNMSQDKPSRTFYHKENFS
jgi:hypothetical protein